MQNFKELIVWQKSIDMVVLLNPIIKRLPKEEMFALSSQLRRSALSIPSNIAEGNARNSTRQYLHFLSIAIGSRAELETQLILCVRLGYFTEIEIQEAMKLLSEIGKMLNSLMKRLSTNSNL